MRKSQPQPFIFLIPFKTRHDSTITNKLPTFEHQLGVCTSSITSTALVTKNWCTIFHLWNFLKEQQGFCPILWIIRQPAYQLHHSFVPRMYKLWNKRPLNVFLLLNTFGHTLIEFPFAITLKKGVMIYYYIFEILVWNETLHFFDYLIPTLQNHI